MKWLLLSRRDRRRASAWTGAGVSMFLAASLAGGRSVPPSPVFWGAAGFVAFVFCVRKAIVLWRVDEMVFDHRPPWNPEPRERRSPPKAATPTLQRTRVAHIVVFAILGVAAARSGEGQQTIFNVPSADVLDPGKVYLEADEFFRPTDPKFSSTTIRGIVGVFPRVEAGVNFGGFVSPGPVVPTATVAVKGQPLRWGDFAVTVGGYGLFFLRGNEDGNPAGMGYGFASYRLPKLGTRIELGGWYASAGFVHPLHRPFGSSTGGALATFEQPFPWVKGLTLAADWWSGENAIGYISPGFIYTFGQWIVYGAYSIKNGNSKGNGLLLELGFNVP